MVVDTCRLAPVLETFLTAHSTFGAFAPMTMKPLFSARRRDIARRSLTEVTPKLNVACHQRIAIAALTGHSNQPNVPTRL